MISRLRQGYSERVREQAARQAEDSDRGTEVRYCDSGLAPRTSPSDWWTFGGSEGEAEVNDQKFANESAELESSSWPGWALVLLAGVPSCCAREGDAVKLIEQDGWSLVRTRGSHRHFKHPRKLGLVTIAGHPSVDIPRGTLNSILRQAGLKTE